eukprot:6597308-Heterocapsa_arctica.AAC.1
MVIQFGNHTLRTQNVTQSNVALSSGESEFGALVKGAENGLGIQSLAADLGIGINHIKGTDRQ